MKRWHAMTWLFSLVWFYSCFMIWNCLNLLCLNRMKNNCLKLLRPPCVYCRRFFGLESSKKKTNNRKEDVRRTLIRVHINFGQTALRHFVFVDLTSSRRISKRIKIIPTALQRKLFRRTTFSNSDVYVSVSYS